MQEFMNILLKFGEILIKFGRSAGGPGGAGGLRGGGAAGGPRGEPRGWPAPRAGERGCAAAYHPRSDSKYPVLGDRNEALTKALRGELAKEPSSRGRPVVLLIG